MYRFFLFLFFLISLFLLLVIIFQPTEGNDFSSSLSSNPTKLFVKKIRNSTIVFLTIILVILFFLINLILCRFHSHYF